MRKRNRSWRFILVNLILPFNLVISLVFILSQSIMMERNIDENSLKSKRFLHDPLLRVLEREENYRPPRWLGLVATEKDRIIYVADESIRGHLNFSSGDMATFMNWVIRTLPDEITMMPFTYDGTEGLAIYMNNALPFYMRILQKPVYLRFIISTTMLLFLLGILQMNSHQRSVNRLVRASEQIQSRDFDRAIEGDRRSDMNVVFTAFDQMRRTLKANRDRDSRFLLSATHDLKTPLSAMRMYLEAMNDGYIEIGGEAREAVGKVLSKSAILESRIGELLEYSRLTNSSQGTERSIMELEPWLKEQDVLFREECRLNHREYRSSLSVNPTDTLWGGKSVLERAMQNLIDNACRYTEEGDTVFFSARSDGKSLVLTLEDNGPGIAAADRENIFELFYRADKGRNSRGMGIGLASVKSIMETHGGTIICTESPEGGAAFIMELPLP